MSTFFLVSGYAFWGLLGIIGVCTIIDAFTPRSTYKPDPHK